MTVLLNVPEPDPMANLLGDVVGLAVVAQQMPRSVIVAPPSVVIVPPRMAELAVIVKAAVVVRLAGKWTVDWAVYPISVAKSV